MLKEINCSQHKSDQSSHPGINASHRQPNERISYTISTKMKLDLEIITKFLRQMGIDRN